MPDPHLGDCNVIRNAYFGKTLRLLEIASGSALEAKGYEATTPNNVTTAGVGEQPSRGEKAGGAPGVRVRIVIDAT